jgi:hypothetical protein
VLSACPTTSSRKMDLGLALATEPNRTGPALETEQVLETGAHIQMGKVAHMAL